MIESNNPEIDVNQLMERIRAEVARRRDLGLLPQNGSGDAVSTVLPQVHFLARLPPMVSPRRIDVKEERLTSILQRAREKTEVSKRIPKLLRRLFRKQGGYNKLLLESVAVLTRTNVELNKRLQELAGAFEIQNRWLSGLSNTRDADTAWMRAAATIITSIPQQRSEFEGACEHLRNLQTQADGMRAALDSSLARQTEQLDTQIKLGMQINDLHTERHIAAESVWTLRSEFEGAWEHLRNLQAQADGMRAALDSSLARQTEQLDTQIKLRMQINDLLQAQADGMRVAPERISPRPDSQQLDAFYLDFENRFRGARDMIKERLRFYVPILRKARAGRRARPVLDVGCGRGELLELLREQKLEVSGIDLNEAMVAQCKEYHLNVLQADAIEFLRSLPDRSQGAVTAFHLIEHLPFKMLVELIIHTRRVLKPGGIAIFESPNCKNLMVGACYFNIDPTHRNPVFPETAQFMLETHGFERVTLEYLSPVDTTTLGNVDEESPRIRELLYGPQDFAVIGYAPAVE
jgi:2-polyprenyl-3-methyl-5-hydroxy-6-metoxy-1,4-benzoquinol methylase